MTSYNLKTESRNVSITSLNILPRHTETGYILKT